MLAKVGTSVQSFRQQHPRYFVASLASATLLCLVWLAGPSQDSFRQRYADYAYPPAAAVPELDVSNESYPAFGPRNLKTAVARAEQLWATNIEKRKGFVKEQGGYRAMASSRPAYQTTVRADVLHVFPKPSITFSRNAYTEDVLGQGMEGLRSDVHVSTHS